jgi:type IV pilus assembly protein PilC
VIRNNIYFIVTAVVTRAVAFYFWRKTEGGRLTIDRVMLAVPILGQLIRDMTTARFTRSMSTLIAGGLTVPDALEIALDAVTNRELQRRSRFVVQRVREGKPLVDALEEAAWLPELALDMIGVGESSGALQPMFDEVANFFDAEIDVRLSTLTTLIEPVILSSMGVLVMIILLAVYLPILTLIGQIGRGH